VAVNIDLSKNKKQEDYFNRVVEATAGLNSFRYFSYGGAIRGGKTYVTLAILTFLANKYKGSRWHVIREDLPVLKQTTIPSLEKLLQKSPHWRLVRDPSMFYAVNRYGSRIFFKGENIARDPQLNDFLGLETNGFFLEQAEELNKKTWEKALERSGSWYIEPMPPAFIFMTFNPTQNWVKDMIYEPWGKGELKEPFYFEAAFPKDNPFVTDDQWSAWENMAERYKLQFIEGDWNDWDDDENRWAFAFDSTKHIGFPELNREQVVYLSFDFNKNPISCSVIQDYDGKLRVIETIKLPNSDIYALCEHIQAYYPGCLFMATGDASGKSTSALVKDNLNYYIVIQKKLQLGPQQLMVPQVNPRLEHNQMLVNSILANYPVEIHKEKAASLIFDMKHVKKLPDGTIEKRDRNDPKQQADAMDTFRYFCNTFKGDFLKRF